MKRTRYDSWSPSAKLAELLRLLESLKDDGIEFQDGNGIFIQDCVEETLTARIEYEADLHTRGD